MNNEMAYLLGMITGNGEIQRGVNETTVVIEIPHKKLETEFQKDVAIYVKASITDIRQVLEPLLGTSLMFNQSANVSYLSFSKSNEDYLMREILRYIGRATSHENIRISPEVFSFTEDERRQFIKGFADVTGYIRKSNYFFEKEMHRVYFEIPQNWELVTDFCNLLKSVDIPVQNIDWGHPNMRDGNLKKYNEGKPNFWKKERKLRTLDPMAVVANYIMPTRGGSSNFIRESVEISAMERYIREKRKQGYTNLGVTHVFLAAYVQCVAKYPALNRFLSGQQVYSRDDDIQFCMVVKTSMDTSAPESITKLHLKPTDTIDDIYEKLNKGIASIQGQAIGGSDFDKTAKFLSFIPGVLFKFVVWLLKTIDYFGFLPKFLLEVSPFHASIFFTSMGSLGIPPIVHHLYDFGNMPVFVAFGCKYHKNEVLDDGTVVRRKYIDYTVNTDERICDGFYYATTLKHLKRLLSHPEQLDKPAPVVNHDIE